MMFFRKFGKNYWLIIVAFIFLILNDSQGHIFGFKSFVKKGDSLLTSTLSLNSKYMPRIEGRDAVVRVSQNFFQGVIVLENDRQTLQQGAIRLDLESHDVYVSVFEFGYVQCGGLAIIYLMYRRFKNDR